MKIKMYVIMINVNITKKKFRPFSHLNKSLVKVIIQLENWFCEIWKNVERS
jgi:hypothetical protein